MTASLFSRAKSALALASLRIKRPQGRVIVFCGAGISAPSGLAVYRGHTGVWTLSPEARAAIDMDHWPASRPQALAHLALWRSQALQCEPNAAHLRIAAWKRAWPEHVAVITQNVDGLFQKAGLLDSEVMEVHGSLHRMACSTCRHIWPLGSDNAQACPSCGSELTKPSVVFFNEHAPLYPAMAAACDPLARGPKDTFLAIGTSWRVISPDMLLATRGRALGQQINVDLADQPGLDPWMHAQFAGGAIEGVAWAEKLIFKIWKS